jgi:hypothetical protein
MTFPTSDIVKELFSGASNEISELQKQLTEVEQIMVQEWEVLLKNWMPILFLKQI